MCGPAASDVIDLGAGTGKLTRALIEAGHRVVPVEPSERMLAVLRDSVPDAKLGSAEAIPLPDECADVVTAGQAMHWFDLPRALPEISRVLRAGGALAVVWNQFDDRVDWAARFCDATNSEARHSVADALIEDWHPWFGKVGRKDFHHGMPVGPDDLVGLAESFSTVALLHEPERRDVLEQVRAVAPAAAELPLVAVCYRATKS